MSRWWDQNGNPNDAVGSSHSMFQSTFHSTFCIYASLPQTAISPLLGLHNVTHWNFMLSDWPWLLLYPPPVKHFDSIWHTWKGHPKNMETMSLSCCALWDADELTAIPFWWKAVGGLKVMAYSLHCMNHTHSDYGAGPLVAALTAWVCSTYHVSPS